MALGDSYATLAELKSRLGGVTGSGEDAALTSALSVASRAIEHVCRRQFNQAASATARVFYPESRCRALVDDISTTTGLVIKTDDGDDGTYETTWDSTDYQLQPLNGLVDGESGWPYWEIVAVEGRYFPQSSRRAPLEVTAQWGWAAAPAAIKEACLMTAEEVYVLKDAPFGVKGFADLGIVRIRDNMRVMSLLAPYRLNPVLVG